MTAEKHFPPGILYFMKKEGGSVTLSKVPTDFKKETVLGRNMLDLGPHLPAVYENLLEEYVKQADNSTGYG